MAQIPRAKPAVCGKSFGSIIGQVTVAGEDTALFQQALQGDESSVATRLLMAWLEELFDKGLQGVKMLGGTDEQDRATLALNVIAMFNLTTGYFTAQRAFDSMAEGDLRDPDNIARQKSLLRKVVRAMLIN